MSPGDMNVKKTLPRWGRSDPSNSWGRSGRASAALPARAAVARRAGRAVGLVGLGALAAALLGGGISALAQTPPASGGSSRGAAIPQGRVLRVGGVGGWGGVGGGGGGVVKKGSGRAKTPSGGGEPWSGPSWTLGKEFARLLGVQIQPVVVSHETKVPALVANQMDIMIGPLNETAARAKVIDFVIFSNTGVCLFGRADTPRFTGVQTLEDFNRPELTIAYFSGAGEEPLVRQHFAKAKLRGVANSGSVAPIEEVLAGRSDMAPINRMLWPSISKKLKGLAVFPKENDCQDSKIFQIDTGMGVAKEQPAYLEWLRAVARRMQPALRDEERRATQNLKCPGAQHAQLRNPWRARSAHRRPACRAVGRAPGARGGQGGRYLRLRPALLPAWPGRRLCHPRAADPGARGFRPGAGTGRAGAGPATGPAGGAQSIAQLRCLPFLPRRRGQPLRKRPLLRQRQQMAAYAGCDARAGGARCRAVHCRA